MTTEAVGTNAAAEARGASVFRARALTKIYRIGEVEIHALRSVDLDLYDGELVVLLGPSGSGKSTLLNILGGLDAPTSGDVVFRDHVLTGATDRELTRFRREHVGFVFQFYNPIRGRVLERYGIESPFHCRVPRRRAVGCIRGSERSRTIAAGNRWSSQRGRSGDHQWSSAGRSDHQPSVRPDPKWCARRQGTRLKESGHAVSSSRSRL